MFPRIKHCGARYTNFRSYDARERSFEHWPQGLKQSKRVMAKAGFFYTGRSDQVYCFYCGIGLNKWLENDDPFVEHVKWSKRCAYMMLLGGYKLEIIDETTETSAAEGESEEVCEEGPETMVELKKNETSDDECEILTCKMCLDKKMEVLFLPCAHLAVCGTCAPTFSKCLICRSEISEFIKVFIV